MSRDDDLRIRLGRVGDRGRSRRIKPFIAQALVAAEKAGGYKRRSGHSARGSTFGRGRPASFAALMGRTNRRYRQRLDLASGRFAMIDDGLGFSLVPWTPSLERHVGREVLGIARLDRVE